MTQFNTEREYRDHIWGMEASTGIEPVYTDLQSEFHPMTGEFRRLTLVIPNL